MLYHFDGDEIDWIESLVTSALSGDLPTEGDRNTLEGILDMIRATNPTR
jgi:Mg2+/Co2+ transporter CorC